MDDLPESLMRDFSCFLLLRFRRVAANRDEAEGTRQRHAQHRRRMRRLLPGRGRHQRYPVAQDRYDR